MIQYDEKAFVYGLLNKLAGVTTPAEYLDIVSEYPRSRGATGGTLVWIDDASGDTPTWQEVAARWVSPGAITPASPRIGERVPLEKFWIDTGGWFDDPEQLTIVEDMTRTDRLTEVIRTEFYLSIGVQAIVFLPLRSSGRWVSALMFRWGEPQEFTPTDRAIFSLIMRHSAPIINSVRLLMENSKRAQRAERIGELNAALSQAESESEMLDALLTHGSRYGAAAALMFYIHLDSHGNPSTATLVDVQGESSAYDQIGESFALSDAFLSLLNSTISPSSGCDEPAFFEDYALSERLDARARAVSTSWGFMAGILLPLRTGGRWQALVGMNWKETHKFSEEEVESFSRVMPTIASIVASRRAYLAAQDASEEATLLYSLAQSINAATTYQEITDAVAALHPDCDIFQIQLWENFDYATAHYMEVVAATNNRDVITELNTRIFPKESITILEDLVVDDLLVVEDAQHDERLDPQLRAGYKSIHLASFLASMLRRGTRWIGAMSYYYSSPRRFSERDRRLLAGFGDLVMAAVERIHANIDMENVRRRTEENREEAEFLYRLAESFNAAMSYEQVVVIVAGLQKDFDSVFLAVPDSFDAYATEFQLTTIASEPNGEWLLSSLSVPVSSFPIVDALRGKRLWVIEDVEHDSSVDPVSRESFISLLDTRAFLGVSFNPENSGEYQGGFGFRYAHPRTFTEAERRRMIGIGDLVQAAVQRIHSLSETEAAREVSEKDREEASLLYWLAQDINAAMTYQEVADAVVRLAPDVEGIYIQLWDRMDYDLADHYEVVAGAVRGTALRADVDRNAPISKSRLKSYYDQVRASPRPWTVEDVLTDPRTDPAVRETYNRINVRASMVVVLQQGSRWLGSLSFRYSKPRKFDERAKRVALGVGELVQAAVERIRLQMETLSARKRAEEDREESIFLYQLAEAVNSATDYSEIASAVVRIYADCDGVYINLWEHFDIERASYVQVVAASQPDGSMPKVNPVSLPKASMPLAEQMKDERIVVFEDAWNDPRADEVTKATWRALGTRALIAVALRRGSRNFGFVLFNYEKPRVFNERERRRAQGVGDLTLAALERISLQVETDEARRRAEVMAGITAALAQSVDEDAIIEALAHLPELPPGSFVSIQYPVLDSEGILSGFQMRAAVLPDGSHAPHDEWMDVVFRIEDYPTLRILAREPDRVLYLEDYLSDVRPEYQERHDLLHAHGWHSLIAIPLWSGGRWHGNVQLLWQQPHVFSDELKLLLQAVMPVLTSVVSARRSYLAAELARQETEQRVNELTTVAQVSAAAVSLLDESRLLEEFARLTNQRFAPNTVRLYLLDERNTLHRTVLDSSSQDEIIALDSDRLVARAARERRGLIGTAQTKLELASTAHDGTVKAESASSELAVPMVVRESVLGVLNVQSPPGVVMGESHLRVMSTLADLIAVAVQNVRSYRQAQELAALEERTRLARELHDSVSQALYGIGLGAQTARALLDKDPQLVRQPLEYVLSLAQAGLTEMRALIFELRPESLENEGLVTALAKQGASLQARHNIQVQLELCEEPNLALNDKESLFRVAREALHNVVKHSQATKVTLRLASEAGMLVLDVVDNGRGFDTGRDFPGHLGLQSMRERITSLGGNLEIHSVLGEGACIRARLPKDSEKNLRQKPHEKIVRGGED
jgi:signal transduction histidine kinase